MTERLRGRLPLRLSLLFLVLAAVLISLGAVSLANNSLGLVDGFARVGVADGSRTVQLTRTGAYVGYLETPGPSGRRAHVQLRIAGASGVPVRVTAYGGSPANLVYDVGGRHGEARFAFTIGESGPYTVDVRSTDAAPGADLAFGKSIAKGLTAGVALVVPGVLLLLVAIALLVVGLVKRGRHKSELERLHGPRPRGRYRGVG